jgi:hypothetical protein
MRPFASRREWVEVQLDGYCPAETISLISLMNSAPIDLFFHAGRPVASLRHFAHNQVSEHLVAPPAAFLRQQIVSEHPAQGLGRPSTVREGLLNL